MARVNEGNMHYEYYNQNMTKDQAEDYRYAKALDGKNMMAQPQVVYFNGKRYLKVSPESVGKKNGTYLIPYPPLPNLTGGKGRKRKKKSKSNKQNNQNKQTKKNISDRSVKKSEKKTSKKQETKKRIEYISNNEQSLKITLGSDPKLQAIFEQFRNGNK